MKELDDSIIVKFITGTCSDEELARVDEWIHSSDEHAAELFRMERIYRQAQAAAMPRREVERALARLHERIDSTDGTAAADGPSHRPLLKVWHRWAAAVAVLLVACAALYTLRGWMAPRRAGSYIYAKATATTPRQLTLPDGTRVWLNRGASLRYPRQFSDTLREVALNGEGYFEVTKNAARPFVVESDGLKVKVLGTVFNFNTRTAGRMAEVSLIEGSVEVSSHRSAGQVVLMPGQKAQLTQAGQLMVRNVDARIAAVWHNELIPFENSNVRQIANTLEQLYGVTIVVDGSVNRNETYSGQIMWKADIDTVLSLLRNTLPINYTHRNGKVYITPQE